MRITVQLHPRAHEAKVEKDEGGNLHIWVRAVPKKGEANKEMQEVLAKHFRVPKSAVQIVIGKTAREKLVEIKGVDEGEET